MVLSLAALALAIQAAAPPAPPVLRGEELMAALRQGGYTLLVRHARTDRSIPNKETPSFVPPLRADQRNLTAQGEHDVKLMQQVVQKFALPISEVLSSPMYRCRETADAFGDYKVDMALRVFPTTRETAALVAAVPRAGTNRVIVTHHFVIENHVPGISPGDIGESEVAVVKANGNGDVKLVGKILLADWPALAGGAAGSDPMPAAAAAPVHALPGAPPHSYAATAAPATTAGKLATAYLHAFNSGDARLMQAFLENHMEPSADRPMAERIATYTRLFEQYGALSITGVNTSTADRVALRVKSKRGEIVITVTASASTPGRIQSVTFAALDGRGHS